MSRIEFTAVVYKVATLVDGGIRITLDLAGDDKNMIAMTELAACQIHGVALDVEARPYKKNKLEQNGEQQGKSELDKGTKRKSKWATSQE